MATGGPARPRYSGGIGQVLDALGPKKVAAWPHSASEIASLLSGKSGTNVS